MHTIFFQVFDKSVMHDGKGRYIGSQNALILLTTSTGPELIASLCQDPELMPEPNAIDSRSSRGCEGEANSGR